MAGFHPALLSMARDRRLKPTDVRVYILACQHLDFEDYRPLKLLVIAHEAHLTRSVISESLTRLVRTGYLVRGARDSGGGPYLFRLPFSQGVRQSRTPQEPERSPIPT